MDVDTERASQEAAPTKSPPRSVVPVSESKRNRPYIPVSLEPDPEEQFFDRRPTPPTRVFVDSDGPPKGVHIIVLGGSQGSGVKTAGMHLNAALSDFGATVTTIDDDNFHVASPACEVCTQPHITATKWQNAYALLCLPGMSRNRGPVPCD